MPSAALVAENYLPTPGPMIQVVTQKKRELEDRYTQLALFPKRRPPAKNQREHSEQVVARAWRRELAVSANFLELCLVAAGLAEATQNIKAVTSEELQAQGNRLLEMCARATGLDPRPVLLRNRPLLQLAQEERARSNELPPSQNVLERMTQVALGVTAACPIQTLEQQGRKLGDATLSHRCRKAYDGLIGFAQRHSPELNEQMRIVGRAYSEGRLTLEEASRLLQVTPQSAVALLEKCSFCRPLEVIVLKPEARRERLRAIANEVRASIGAWNTPSVALLERDVVASQRIEGMNALPWMMHPEG